MVTIEKNHQLLPCKIRPYLIPFMEKEFAVKDQALFGGVMAKIVDISLHNSFGSSIGPVTTTNNSTGLTSNPIWLLRIVNIYSPSNMRSFSARASFTETEKNDYDTIINTYLSAL